MSYRESFSKFSEDKILWNHNVIVYKRLAAVNLGSYWHPDVPRNDWESFLRLIAGHRVGHLPSVAAAWSQHGTNETQRPGINKYLNNFELLKIVYNFIKPVFSESYSSEWYQKCFGLKPRALVLVLLRTKMLRAG